MTITIKTRLMIGSDNSFTFLIWMSKVTRVYAVQYERPPVALVGDDDPPNYYHSNYRDIFLILNR
jgi:hypothetical protein